MGFGCSQTFCFFVPFAPEKKVLRCFNLFFLCIFLFALLNVPGDLNPLILTLVNCFLWWSFILLLVVKNRTDHLLKKEGRTDEKGSRFFMMIVTTWWSLKRTCSWLLYRFVFFGAVREALKSYDHCDVAWKEV